MEFKSARDILIVQLLGMQLAQAIQDAGGDPRAMLGTMAAYTCPNEECSAQWLGRLVDVSKDIVLNVVPNLPETGEDIREFIKAAQTTIGDEMPTGEITLDVDG